MYYALREGEKLSILYNVSIEAGKISSGDMIVAEPSGMNASIEVEVSEERLGEFMDKGEIITEEQVQQMLASYYHKEAVCH